jgi:hypothetical protein
MRNIIEMAIEREAELLDAMIEFPELVDGPTSPWTPSRGRINPLTHKFTARGSARRLGITRAPAAPRYVH